MTMRSISSSLWALQMPLVSASGIFSKTTTRSCTPASRSIAPRKLNRRKSTSAQATDKETFAYADSCWPNTFTVRAVACQCYELPQSPSHIRQKWLELWLSLSTYDFWNLDHFATCFWMLQCLTDLNLENNLLTKLPTKLCERNSKLCASLKVLIINRNQIRWDTKPVKLKLYDILPTVTQRH